MPCTANVFGERAGASTIPARYETTLSKARTEERERPFGTSSKRFPRTRNALPGPGSYHSESTIEGKSESFSKKGYGNGFVSASGRTSFGRGSFTPGPGAYESNTDPTTLVSNKRSSRLGGSTFGRDTAVKGTATKDLVGSFKTAVLEPGPGSYDPSEAEAKVLRRGAHTGTSAAFKSSARRGMEDRRDVPAPGSYNVSDTGFEAGAAKGKTKGKAMPSASFRSKAGRTNFAASAAVKRAPRTHAERLLQDASDLTAPGPGAYSVELGTIGAKRQTSKPKRAQPFKGLREVQTGVRRDKANDTPGPGAYETAARPVDRQYISGSVFLSNSSRLSNPSGTLGASAKPPGPAYYSSADVPGKKSFLLNDNGRWV